MEEHRDRSSGWKHAKLSGHSNEELVCEMLQTDKYQQERLLKTLNEQGASITRCIYGGLHEKNVPSILGGTTKNKADITVWLNNGKKYGISIKKSLAGQVFLVRDTHFIKGFELQYGKIIPENIKRAISLFWGSASDTISIINSYSNEDNVKELELHKCRLSARTLKRYDQALYDELLEWFKDNIYEITDYCFARGQAKNTDDRATIVWYINLLGEHNVDEMHHIDSLCELAEKNKDTIAYGSVNGGTTIQLPFGFVQWHQEQMQFHHKYDTINSFTSVSGAKISHAASSPFRSHQSITPGPSISMKPESKTMISLKEVSDFLAKNGKSTIEQISERTNRQISELKPILEGGVIGKLFSKNADGTYELRS